MKAVCLASLILFGVSTIHGAAQEPRTSIVRKDGQNAWVAASKYYEARIEDSAKPSLTINERSNGQIKIIGRFPLLADLAFAPSGASFNESGSLIEGKLEQAQHEETLILKYAIAAGTNETLIFHFYSQYFTYQSSWEHVLTSGKPFWINYFTQSPNDTTADSSFFVENEEISTWTPDLYHALIPERGLSRVILSSHASSGVGSYLRGFGAGSPLVPPYVASLRTGTEWWGIGTVAMPAMSNGLDLTIGRKQLEVSFGSGQVADRQSKVEGPIVGIFFGDQPKAILSEYLSAVKEEVSDPDREERKQWHTWWSGPIYCTWGDQAYAARIKEGTLQEDHGGRYITDANLSKWIDLAKQKELPIRIVIIDLGWMLDYGDFEPNPARFANLRKTIDQLHSAGLHVLLWIPMYEATGSLFSPDKTVSAVATKHPDWLIKDRDGRSTDVFDFTNPGVREYVKQRIHFLLTSDANGLDADGLKVDFMDRVPDPAQSKFFDPTWGVGELMQARVLELIYASAKEAKSDALIDSSFMNPFFTGTEDVVRLSDDVSDSIDTYWWRAWAASSGGVPPIDGDDWWAMERYFVPLTLAKAAWGIPNIYALEFRGTLGTEGTVSGISGIASGGYPVAPGSADYHRVSAILHVYLHAPARNDQRVIVDPSAKQASRYYTAGVMAGSPVAMTLNHGYALATYDEESIWLASISDDTIVLPIAVGRKIGSVRRVSPGGQNQSISFARVSDGSISFAVKDSGEDSGYYIVSYLLPDRKSD